MNMGKRAWMRVGVALVAAALVLAAGGIGRAADQTVAVYVNGKLLKCTPAARVHKGVTYVPLRAAAEAVKGEVTWMAKDQMAVVCRGGQCVPVRKAQGIMVGGSLLIPLKIVGTVLKYDVRWDAKSRSVRLTTH